MKKYLLFIILIIFHVGINAQNKINKNIATKNQCVPDSNYFLGNHVNQTYLLYSGDSINLMGKLSKSQMTCWLKTFHQYDQEDIRMASFQGKHNGFYSILLLANIENMQQCLINVDTLGRFIDGLVVAYTSNIGNMGFVKNKEGNYIVSLEVRSKFNKDTISYLTLNSVSRDSLPHNDSLVWEELYLKKYLINNVGKINVLSDTQLLSSSRKKNRIKS